MNREIMQQVLDAFEAIMFERNAESCQIIAENARYTLRQELAKPEPIYVMGQYAGEGRVVGASFGLPKGAFEFAPHTGAGEASKIKHSLEPEQDVTFTDEGNKQEPVCDKDPSLCGFVQCQLGKVCKNVPINIMPTKIFAPNLEQILNAAGFYRREWVCKKCGERNVD